MVDDDLENKPLVEVYDTLLIPALALAETDWHRGELDEGRHKFILQSLKEMIHERGEGRQEVHEKESSEDMEGRADSSLRSGAQGPASSACPLATRRMKSPE